MTGLALAIASAAGCAKTDKTPKKPDIDAIPAGNFARNWQELLNLKSDAADRLYVRGDNVFLYTKGNVAYVMNRTGGNLKFINRVEVSGGTLRPPVIMGTAIVYPSGSTIEIYNDRGLPIKTIPLEKPTRSGGVAIAQNLYIGLDHTGGAGVLANIDVNLQYRWVRWELMTFGAMTPTPATFDRVIFYASEDGTLGACNEERAGVWPLKNGVFKTLGKFVSDVKVDDFGVYASNTDTKLYCLDRITGNQVAVLRRRPARHRAGRDAEQRVPVRPWPRHRRDRQDQLQRDRPHPQVEGRRRRAGPQRRPATRLPPPPRQPRDGGTRTQARCGSRPRATSTRSSRPTWPTR